MPQRVASFGNGYGGISGEGFEGVYDFSKPQQDFSMEKEDFPALGGKGPGNMGGLVPRPVWMPRKDRVPRILLWLDRVLAVSGRGFGAQGPGRQGSVPGAGQFDGGTPPLPGKPGAATPAGPSGTSQKDRYGLLGLLP